MDRVMTKALTVLASFAVVLAVLTSAGWSTKIYDPSTKKWITYDAKRVKNAARGPTVDPRYERQVVDFRTAELPGTIIIDSDSKFLYFVSTTSINFYI